MYRFYELYNKGYLVFQFTLCIRVIILHYPERHTSWKRICSPCARGDLAILHMNRPKNKVHLVSFDVTSVFPWSSGAVSRSERSVNLYQVVEPQSVLSTRVKFVCKKSLQERHALMHARSRARGKTAVKRWISIVFESLDAKLQRTVVRINQTNNDSISVLPFTLYATILLVSFYLWLPVRLGKNVYILWTEGIL